MFNTTLRVIMALTALLLIAPTIFAAEDSRGTIAFVEGEVLIDGQQVDFGDEIAVGARVQTGLDSMVEITFGQGNIFRLGENTVAVLNIDENFRNVEVRRGIFAAVFDRLLSIGGNEADQFRLRTPTAIGGVRGTSFYVRVLNDNNTYICTCNGTVHIQSGSRAMEVAAHEHEAYMFSGRADGSTTTIGAKVIYHDNDYMDQLASKVGARIPWGTVGSSNNRYSDPIDEEREDGAKMDEDKDEDEMREDDGDR